jgi:hypothetical protein
MSSEFQQETHRMAIPSNGITPKVIREIMPPYQLGADLLRATFATLPDASAVWRETPSTTREVLRHRSSDAKRNGTAPRSAA